MEKITICDEGDICYVNVIIPNERYFDTEREVSWMKPVGAQVEFINCIALTICSNINRKFVFASVKMHIPKPRIASMAVNLFSSRITHVFIRNRNTVFLPTAKILNIYSVYVYV